MRRLGLLIVVLMSALAVTAPASAFDPEQTFTKNGVVLSLDGGYGWQNDLEKKGRQTELELWWLQGRASFLPFGTSGKGSFLYGAFELGLEPVYQRYTGPVDAYFAGLGFSTRYHFLGLGRFAPYVEVGGAAGGTNLRAIEIDSNFAFRVYGGLGASVFVSDNVALYAGYRLIHVSNGNTSRPNRGFEADAVAAGISFFLP